MAIDRNKARDFLGEIENLLDLWHQEIAKKMGKDAADWLKKKGRGSNSGNGL